MKILVAMVLLFLVGVSLGKHSRRRSMLAYLLTGLLALAQVGLILMDVYTMDVPVVEPLDPETTP